MASKRPKLSARVLACRKNGSKGGRVTAERHGKEFCVARAENAGITVRNRYGASYYQHIARLRKNRKGWPKGKPKKPVTVDLTQAVMGA